MNRIGHDYLEKLLYEIFVSNDEATTLGNLAALLQQDPQLVTRAASLACRLGSRRGSNPREVQLLTAAVHCGCVLTAALTAAHCGASSNLVH